MTEIPTWDEYFYNMAKLVSTKSKDLSTKIGAVIVGPDNEVVSTGYNSFPRGLNDDLMERQERPEKYFWFEHGERNAIFTAASRGVPLKGCRIFLSCFVPCTDCTRAIIQVGITEIVLGTNHEDQKLKWLESAIRSLTMLKESGVKLRYSNSKDFINCDKMVSEIKQTLKDSEHPKEMPYISIPCTMNDPRKKLGVVYLDQSYYQDKPLI